MDSAQMHRYRAGATGPEHGTPVLRGESGGSVLLLALWTLFFLSALALAVASYVGGGISLASALKSEHNGYFAARAGVELAIATVMADSNEWDSLTERWSDDEDEFLNVPVGSGSFTVSRIVERDRDDAQVRYGLSDEESRINLNAKRTNRAVLRALLERVGRLDPVNAGQVADAVLDWRDADDQQLTDGAETPYYQTQPVAYGCANGPFTTVQELLLVRGVDRELFLALDPYITVYGSGEVNINTAGPTVLAVLADAVAGDGVSAAETLPAKVDAFRAQGNVFKRPDKEGVVGIIPGLTPDEEATLTKMMPYLNLKSTCFRGVVDGHAHRDRSGAETPLDGRGDRRIVFVFDRDNRARLMWRED